MIKVVKLQPYYTGIRVPDSFFAAVQETNQKAMQQKEGEIRNINEVLIYFGKNMDIIVCTAKGKRLSNIDLERIELLVGIR
jgi:hypothetical protein